MSVLDFLTPQSEAAVARSPMERLARTAGARFEHRDGWNVAVSFGESGVGQVAFADRSHLTKLECHGAPEALARLAGNQLEPGTAVRTADAWWCPVTPSRVLVVADSSARPAAPSSGVSVVDVTCGLAAMALIGPAARELLARFCAIDVRPAVTSAGSFRPGSVARTPGYVLVEDHERLLVMVGWALGEYLFEVVADAAANLGGGPIGADALAGFAAGTASAAGEVGQLA